MMEELLQRKGLKSVNMMLERKPCVSFSKGGVVKKSKIVENDQF